MKRYSFVKEFCCNCSASIGGTYESPVTKCKPLTSKPIESFLNKHKKKGSDVKKTHINSLMKECINLFCMKYINENWNPDYDDKPKNEFGEDWKIVHSTDPVYIKIDRIVKGISYRPEKADPCSKDRYRRIHIGDIHLVNYKSDNPHYILRITGGANGGGPKTKLLTYIRMIYEVVKELKKEYSHVWFVDWSNDCCDDVWNFRVCFDNKD